MILEIALGIVLGFLILANLRSVVAMTAFAAMCLVILAALGAIGWLLFVTAGAALETAQAVPPLPAVAVLIFSVLMNLLFAFAVGEVIQTRSGLPSREAMIFGAVFYVLFLLTAITAPFAAIAYAETNALAAPLLYLLVVLGAWVFVVRQFLYRKSISAGRFMADKPAS